MSFPTMTDVGIDVNSAHDGSIVENIIGSVVATDSRQRRSSSSMSRQTASVTPDEQSAGSVKENENLTKGEDQSARDNYENDESRTESKDSDMSIYILKSEIQKQERSKITTEAPHDKSVLLSIDIQGNKQEILDSSDADNQSEEESDERVSQPLNHENKDHPTMNATRTAAREDKPDVSTVDNGFNRSSERGKTPDHSEVHKKYAESSQSDDLSEEDGDGNDGDDDAIAEKDSVRHCSTLFIKIGVSVGSMNNDTGASNPDQEENKACTPTENAVKDLSDELSVENNTINDDIASAGNKKSSTDDENERSSSVYDHEAESRQASDLIEQKTEQRKMLSLEIQLKDSENTQGEACLKNYAFNGIKEVVNEPNTTTNEKMLKDAPDLQIVGSVVERNLQDEQDSGEKSNIDKCEPNLDIGEGNKESSNAETSIPTKELVEGLPKDDGGKEFALTDSPGDCKNAEKHEKASAFPPCSDLVDLDTDDERNCSKANEIHISERERSTITSNCSSSACTNQSEGNYLPSAQYSNEYVKPGRLSANTMDIIVNARDKLEHDKIVIKNRNFQSANKIKNWNKHHPDHDVRRSTTSDDKSDTDHRGHQSERTESKLVEESIDLRKGYPTVKKNEQTIKNISLFSKEFQSLVDGMDMSASCVPDQSTAQASEVVSHFPSVGEPNWLTCRDALPERPKSARGRIGLYRTGETENENTDRKVGDNGQKAASDIVDYIEDTSTDPRDTLPEDSIEDMLLEIEQNFNFTDVESSFTEPNGHDSKRQNPGKTGGIGDSRSCQISQKSSREDRRSCHSDSGAAVRKCSTGQHKEENGDLDSSSETFRRRKDSLSFEKSTCGGLKLTQNGDHGDDEDLRKGRDLQENTTEGVQSDIIVQAIQHSSVTEEMHMAGEAYYSGIIKQSPYKNNGHVTRDEETDIAIDHPRGTKTGPTEGKVGKETRQLAVRENLVRQQPGTRHFLVNV
ncbi:uro-adherence factor A-like [Ptychodera flava]|uniref:uro-adherence factor A-like n=1 Tax=Ptychodera flava TaxID=63121 RepID=UPI00396A43C5